MGDASHLLHLLKRFQLRQHLFVESADTVGSDELPFVFGCCTVGEFEGERAAFEVAAVVESHSQSVVSRNIEQPVFGELPPSRNPPLHILFSRTLPVLEVEAANFLLRKHIRQLLHFAQLQHLRRTHRLRNVGVLDSWTRWRFPTLQHEVKLFVFLRQF